MYAPKNSALFCRYYTVQWFHQPIVAASEVRTMEGFEASGKQSECNRPEVDKSGEILST